MRRALIVLVCLPVILLAALLTLPLWIGGPLKLAGRRHGMSFERLERLDGGRIALHNVRWQGRGFDARAARIEGDLSPWRMLQNRGRLGSWAADDWSVDIVSPEAPAAVSSPPIRGWVDLRERLDRILHSIDNWFADVRLGSGRIALPGRDEIRTASALWRNDSLGVSGLQWGRLSADGRLTWPQQGGLTVELASAEEKWRLTATSTTPDSAEGRVEFRGQQGAMRAHFAERGWLPEAASISAADWTLAGRDAGLAPAYEDVGGGLELEWSQGRFSAAIHARAQPAPNAMKGLPPLSLELGFSGDVQALTVQRISITGPGLSASLAAPVIVARGGALLSPETEIRIEADLSRFPGLEAEGKIDGSAQVMRTRDGRLALTGEFKADRLRGKGWDASTAQASAEFSWPNLSVRSASFQSKPWGAVSLKGDYDFSTGNVTNGSIEGVAQSSFVARWLGVDVGFDDARFSATAEGPLTRLTHSGEIALTKPRWKQASAKSLKGAWNGSGERLNGFALSLEGTDEMLTASGSADRDGALIKSLQLFHGAEMRLSLEGQATIEWEPHLRIEGLRLRGPAGYMSLDGVGGEQGRVELDVKGLAPAWLAGFVAHDGPDWKVHALKLEAEWSRGPVTFAVQGGGEVDLGGQGRPAIALTARGDAAGMEGSRLDIASGGTPIARMTGRIPASLHALPSWGITLMHDQDLGLELDLDRNASFWKWVGDSCGLALVDPRVAVRVAGTLKAPRGEATVAVDRILMPARQGTGRLPAVEELRARVVGDGASLRLQEFSARLSGQTVKASGRLPLPAEWPGGGWSGWQAWISSHLDAELAVPETRLEAFASIADRWISPNGSVAIEVALKPGMKWTGEAHLRGAASRPVLGPLGALQDVDADIVLDGRTVRIGRFEARSGGQPVSAAGEATRGDGGEWRMAFNLKGSNLPLVRQAGLLVRGDVDLRVRTTERGGGEIAGRAVLRDSLLLMDLRSIVSSDSIRASPLRRPPYFSVTTEPFAGWKLGVDVEGGRFLRLKSPLFSGVASAHFRLAGTLAEPLAVGEVVIDEGRVMLPFATFQVEQAGVSLVESAPYDPRVSLEGASRRMGYDLRMEMTGSAAHPNIVFSSSPPLDSEQVLRLVMAGEAPQGEIAFSAQQRALRLGAYLGQALAGQLGADASQAENFSLTVGERVSREGRETYALEVPLDQRWSLTGEYDEFDEYNVGVKWRAFRDRPRDAAPGPGEAGEGKEGAGRP